MKQWFLIVKDSPISGKGVFANSKIKKGESICFFDGTEISLLDIMMKINKGIIDDADPLQIDDETYIIMEEQFRLINHLCSPNCFIRGKNELIALRNITRDEELTYDYSTTMWEEDGILKKEYNTTRWKMKCNCCVAKCRKIIDQFYLLPKNIQEFYIKNKYLPDFILRKFI